MISRTNFYFRRAAVAAILILLLGPGLSAAKAQDDAASTNRKAQITVKFADIHGQVFIASEKRGSRELPAKGVYVQVMDVPSNHVQRTATTDDDGKYTVAQLPPGWYTLHIGALQLSLEVTAESPDVRELPKIIIAILPKEMARDGSERHARERER